MAAWYCEEILLATRTTFFVLQTKWLLTHKLLRTKWFLSYQKIVPNTKKIVRNTNKNYFVIPCRRFLRHHKQLLHKILTRLLAMNGKPSAADTRQYTSLNTGTPRMFAKPRFGRLQLSRIDDAPDPSALRRLGRQARRAGVRPGSLAPRGHRPPARCRLPASGAAGCQLQAQAADG